MNVLRINEDYIEDIAQDDLISSHKEDDQRMRDYRVRVFIYYFINNSKQKKQYTDKLVKYIKRVASHTFDDMTFFVEDDSEPGSIEGDFRNVKVDIRFDQKVHVRDLWRFVNSIYSNTKTNICKITLYVETYHKKNTFGQLIDNDVRIVLEDAEYGSERLNSKLNRKKFIQKFIDAFYEICIENGGEMYKQLFHYLPGFFNSNLFECELEIGSKYAVAKDGSPLPVNQYIKWKPDYRKSFDLWLVADDNKEPVKLEDKDRLYQKVKIDKPKVYDKFITGYIETNNEEVIYMTVIYPHLYYDGKVFSLFIVQKNY